MLRFKIKEMIARREFEEGRRITIAEVAEGAGIHRVTLSKMINRRGFSTSTEHIDGLCRYFDCKIEDLVEYVPSERVSDLDDQGRSN
ncbi:MULTISPECIES: helix-turn-helix transcriptional regulator [Pseudomonadaceae]|uniref:helix-turn-helix domain-containing protein n=1 Tax=Pseudomonadaceae TaxID=135621 RepID=UPI000C58BC3C|nr:MULTISPECIES: helix-turn-helix transcriptional regulator [Pseudomonadaceae]MAK73547.1 transcriptional regulator [Pseudomonadales bacterium]MAQ52441.1 transcriptional regulator [Pseudomonas sp.]MCL5042068.1 helix-turn-helix transcriptional regulator [Gammaproteobacteria bacterium]MAP77467.1 transcriptional regulator [Pseudomonadales bacterium]MBB49246.1 transcriptional regulator [Pseudomonadales bacterium]